MSGEPKSSKALAKNVESIAEAFKIPVKKLPEFNICISGKVLSNIEGNYFMFCDKSTAIGVDIKAQKHQNSPFLKEGKFVKIMRAGIQQDPKRLLLLQSTIVVPARTIHVVGDQASLQAGQSVVCPVEKIKDIHQYEPKTVRN